MNKRQRAKRRKRELVKTTREVEGFMRSALKHFIGKFVDPDAIDKVKDAVADFFKKMAQYPVMVSPGDAPVTGVFTIMRTLQPPYKPWADEGNVVHWTGIETRDKHDLSGPYTDYTLRRVCDFVEVTEDRMVEPDETVTCVRCHAVAHERMRP